MYILTREFLIENIIKKDESEIEIVSYNIDNYYTPIEIQKTKGKRTIFAIDNESDLYKMQKNIQRNFLSKIPLPMCVKGFCKNTSYAEFLAEHKKQKYYMRIDIKDFFDTITEEQIRENLSEFVKDDEALDILMDLCTYYGVLPQGAVTSPAISNIIFRRIDQRITKYCQKLNVKYTRYADDLMFSSSQMDFKPQKWFYKKIAYILKDMGFRINTKKTRNQKEKIALNGFVVKDVVSLSRKKLNNINKIIYYFKDKTQERFRIDCNSKDWLNEVNNLGLKDKNNKDYTFENEHKFINYLCGYRSFLLEIAAINQEQKNRKVTQIIHKVNQIEKIIDWFCIKENELKKIDIFNT